jgi:hypothetical protein
MGMVLGYLPVALGGHPYLSLAIAATAIVAVVRLFGRPTNVADVSAETR